MIKYITSCFLIGNVFIANAQNSDVIKKQEQQKTTNFDSKKLLNTEFKYYTPFKYEGKRFDGTELPSNKIKQLYQSVVGADINLIANNKWFFGTKLFYNYLHAETNNIGSESVKSDIHYYTTELNVMRFSKLFNKSVIYTASIIPSGGNDGFERVTGLVSGTLILKADASTKMTIGLLGFVDPSSIVPVTLTFSYEKRFKNGWIFDLNLPQRIFMKKDLSDHERISLGSELNTTNFYLNEIDKNKKTYMFSQAEILTGLTYEYSLLKKVKGSIKSGFVSVPFSRMVELNKSFSNYEYDLKQKSTFYINVGLSYRL